MNEEAARTATALAAPPADRNPFVGPRSLIYGERIYGRSHEIIDLCRALVAQRIVLLYSPSGAGKTSLLEAGLRPELERRDFLALPTIRVGYEPVDPGASATSNRYVLSTLACLEASPDEQLGRAEVARVSLTAYLQQLAERAGPDVDPCLIFDQFEELFLVDPTDQQAKAEFLSDLGTALRDRRWRAVFSMREDFIAQLDPYLSMLPTRLAIRHRLDLLGPSAAQAAVRSTARDGGIEFTDHAARMLIDDLRRVRVQRGGATRDELGPSVEPVQLQVVCRQLWSALSPGTTSIGPDNIAALAHVDDALADFYASEVEQVAAGTGATVREIRGWFDEHLITESGFRAQVLRGPGRNGPAVLRALEDAHLIRSEQHRGTDWFELAHDRLVEPIRASNAAWRQGHLSMVQQQAQTWERRGRPAGLLLTGDVLVEAEAWATAHPHDLLPVDEEFLDACRAERHHQDLERTSARRRLIAAGAVCTIAVVALAVVTVFLRRAADAEDRVKAQQKETAAMALAAQARANQMDNPALALALAAEGSMASEAPTAIVREALADAVTAADAATWQPVRQPFEGHPGPVFGVAFSPDGKVIASAGTDGTILLSDARTGLALDSPLVGHDPDSNVSQVTFSPDGTLLASAGDDGTVRLWDPTTHQQIGQPLEGHAGPVVGVAFNPDGTLLASASFDGTVRLWDPTTHQQIGQPLEGHEGGVWAVAFSPDGKLLASAGEDTMVRLWDPTTHQQIGSALQGHTDDVVALAFNPDGTLLASAGELDDRKIWLWDLTQPEPAGKAVAGHARAVTAVAFSPDGRLLASGSGDKSIRFWNPITRRPIGTPLTGHDNTVFAISFDATGTMLASGSADRTVRRWDIAPSSAAAILGGQDGATFGVHFSPDGATVATSGEYGTVRLWSRKTQAVVGPPLVGHEGNVSRVVFSPDGTLLASAGDDGTVRLWDPTTHQQIGQPTEVHTDPESGLPFPVVGLAFNPHGTLLASASFDGTVRLWHPTTHQQIGEPLQGHDGAVWAVEFSPDGKLLASAGQDGTVRLWDPITHQQIGEPLQGHDGAVLAVVFSPDGNILASTGNDKAIRFWDLATGQPIGEPMTGHVELVNGLDFSPDGSLLASASQDLTVRLWDVATQQPHGAPLEGHTGFVWAVAFSTDGELLASASNDGDVRLHRPVYSAEGVCELVAPYLTVDQLARLLPPDFEPRCVLDG